MLVSVKTALKEALVPVIYRYPPTGLQPDRLGVVLHGLLERAHLDGDVAEIGCNLGGTSILAFKGLRRAGWKGRYICFDTFGGFVEDQYAADVEKGTTTARRNMFAANSVRLVRKILNYHDCPDIQLVPGDITKVRPGDLSERYSAVLLDIDLSDPTYEALKIFWPRMASGGAIFVDDCMEGHNWKARLGYERFCTEMDLPQEYRHGLGILRKP